MFTTKCEICGEPFARKLTGRKRLFCSDHCRDRMRRERNNLKFGNARGRCTQNAETAATAVKNKGPGRSVKTHETPPKSSIKPATFEAENRGRAPRIYGPRPVIDVEIFDGRAWREIVSADGVISLFAMLQPPVLRAGGAS